jgi:hypothetical protein
MAMDLNILPDPQSQIPASQEPVAMESILLDPLTDLPSRYRAPNEHVPQARLLLSERSMIAGVSFSSFKEEDGNLFHRKECKKLERKGLYSKGRYHPWIWTSIRANLDARQNFGEIFRADMGSLSNT